MSAHIMTDETSEENIMGGETMSDSASGANGNLTWFEANQRYLAAALSALRVHLQATLRRADDSACEPATQAEDALLDPGAWTFSQPPALEQLCSAFELSANTSRATSYRQFRYLQARTARLPGRGRRARRSYSAVSHSRRCQFEREGAS